MYIYIYICFRGTRWPRTSGRPFAGRRPQRLSFFQDGAETFRGRVPRQCQTYAKLTPHAETSYLKFRCVAVSAERKLPELALLRHAQCQRFARDYKQLLREKSTSTDASRDKKEKISKHWRFDSASPTLIFVPESLTSVKFHHGIL